MSRHNLTDREWKSIRGFLPSERPAKAGRPWISHRQMINGILYVLVTGCSWRDLPEEFGKWNTVYRHLSTHGSLSNNLPANAPTRVLQGLDSLFEHRLLIDELESHCHQYSRPGD